MGPFAIAVLQALPGLIAAGRDSIQIINEANTRISTGRDPTPADWDWLNAQIKGLQDRLHAPGT